MMRINLLVLKKGTYYEITPIINNIPVITYSMEMKKDAEYQTKEFEFSPKETEQVDEW